MAKLFKRIGIDLLATGGTDVRVRVTLNDTTSGFLNDKLSVSTGKLTKSIANPSGNESLDLDVNEAAVDHDALLNYEVNEHRALDDTSTTTTNLWSADKIQTELNGKVNSIPNPVSDNKLVKSIGLDGINVEQTGIDVDDSNNVTGVNDLTIAGDLTVNGTEFIANVETIDVEDPNIGLNRNGTQATANAQKGGLTVQMTDATDAIIGYDSTTTSKFKVGEDGDEREVATTTHTQTFTNKTIDATNNSISNLQHGTEVDDPSSGVHGVTGDIVGTTDTQDLSNKAIINPSRVDVRKDTEANLITYAGTATDGQLVFATDSEEFFGVVNNALTQLGGSDISDSATLLNNQTTLANVGGFLVNGSSGFSSKLSVLVDADTDLRETFFIEGHFTGSDWEITYNSQGDSSVFFDMTAGGQLQYTSADYTGYVTATATFEVDLI